MNRREKILAYGAWIAVCLIWGTTYLAIRIAVRTLPDAWMAGVRFAIAGSLMCLLLWWKGEPFPPLRQWTHLGIIGVALIGMGNWFVVIAEKTIQSGPTALLIAVTPFYMVFLEPVVCRLMGIGNSGKLIHSKQIVGLLVGFSGVGLLILPDLRMSGWHSGMAFGLLIVQFGSVAWALGSLYSKYKKIDASPLVNASLQMLLGGLFLCVIALFRGEFSQVHYERTGVIALLYLIFIGAMVGYVSYIYALDKLPSSLVSMYGYINPVIAVWLGWVILDEKVTWTTVAATAIILSGVWLVKGAGTAAIKTAEPLAAANKRTA